MKNPVLFVAIALFVTLNFGCKKEPLHRHVHGLIFQGAECSGLIKSSDQTFQPVNRDLMKEGFSNGDKVGFSFQASSSGDNGFCMQGDPIEITSISRE